MLKHIVMWKLKEFAEGKTKAENALIMKESLERLVGIIPEIKSLQVGINEKTSDMAYDAVLISTFEDADALARAEAGDAELQELIADGTAAEISEKYFGMDVTQP